MTNSHVKYILIMLFVTQQGPKISSETKRLSHMYAVTTSLVPVIA